jgi:hypothetical protein
MNEAPKYELGKLHQGLAYEDYDSQAGVRASHLKHLKRSPAHLQAAIAEPRAPTDALEFGKLFHYAVENGERFLDTYVVEPGVDKRTKVGREVMDQFYEDVEEGQIIVKAKWAKPLLGMLQSIMGHRIAYGMLKGCVRETSCWVRDPDTGLVLKFRPDILTSSGRIVDLKTTRNAGPSFFMNQIFSDRYEDDPFYVLSAAHYTHGGKLSGICNHQSMIYIAIEKEAPYGVMIYPLSEGEIDPGEQWRHWLMRKYAKCQTEGKWPGYDERAYPVVVPQWMSEPPSVEAGIEEVGF